MAVATAVLPQNYTFERAIKNIAKHYDLASSVTVNDNKLILSSNTGYFSVQIGCAKGDKIRALPSLAIRAENFIKLMAQHAKESFKGSTQAAIKSIALTCDKPHSYSLLISMAGCEVRHDFNNINNFGHYLTKYI